MHSKDYDKELKELRINPAKCKLVNPILVKWRPQQFLKMPRVPIKFSFSGLALLALPSTPLLMPLPSKSAYWALASYWTVGLLYMI